jgi:hypothetical protein
MDMFENEQFVDMESETAKASLRYYEEVFELNTEKLLAGDSEEWEKAKSYPPTFMMEIEQLLCKAYNLDQGERIN